MIFAPRSWPSSPGLATTTLILPAATIRQYTAVKLTVVGCSPAWPNPGGAQSGYLVEGPGRLLLDCGPGVLGKLRERDGGWPVLDAIVITHWHLDHWGDLVPWVWGTMFLGAAAGVKPELWLPPEGRDELRAFGDRLGFEGMWERAYELRDYREGEPFTAAGMTVTATRLPHYTLRTYGLRVEDGSRSLAYSGDSAPSERLAELARGADLFLCEATLAGGELDGDPRGHLSADEACAAFAASGAARLLLTHRPHELPLADGLEQAHDGLELEL
jgi:ribonuclease BN (tRNA processing enzyme)